jgi:hypothetical protein
MAQFVRGSAFLFFLLVVGAFALGQSTPSNIRHSAKTPTAATATQPDGTAPGPSQSENRDTPVAGFGTKLAQSVVGNTSDPDDHVRCFFTLRQLMELRPVPGVAKLTEADQSQVLTSVVEAVDSANDKELTADQKTKFIGVLAGDLDGQLVGKTPGEALATIMNILYQIKNKDQLLYESARDKSSIRQMILEEAGSEGNDFSQELQKKLDDPNANWFKPNDPGTTLSKLANLVANVPETRGKSISPPELTVRTRVAGTLNNASSGGSANSQLSGTVVSSVRDAINKLAPPADIGCAYQIMSWNQSRLLFGRSVANDFIAVQVTVRNLNAKEEFIVHNAMLSVDADINGAIGRYFEGADKISVEAYNNAGESLTARGIVGNSISAASALLSTLQPIVNVGNFSNAVAAFTGGGVPGWKTMSPDHQKDQLLLIANSGFSATYTTKTVVGKSGAATFYTWFPAKPFLQGWWLQDCAQSIVTVGDPPTKGASPPQVGVDLKRAQKVCASATTAGWKTIPFHKWSSISDDLFRDLSLAVVAGIHVQEDSKNKSSITDLKCPKNARGELDLSKASDGTLSCDLTGASLDKVAKLRLENAGNDVDPVRPEGTVTVSGDNTSAKTAFKVSDLASAPGDTYNVYAVGKDGSETATGQNVHLDLKTITLTGVEPGKIDLGSLPGKITLTGYNLNNLNKVCFSNESNPEKPASDVKKDSSKTQATLDPSSLKLSAGAWEIYLNDCSDSNDSKQKLTITGAAAPQISSFSPASAVPGQTVTIKGSNLLGATAVTFGGVEAKPLTLAADGSQLTVVVPSGAQSGTIGLTTPGGTGRKDGFKVLPKPKPAAQSKPPAKTPK